MRIAMIGHKRIPSREGGIEVVVEELAVRMAAEGHQVTVFNRSGHHVSGKENDNNIVKQRDYKGVRMVEIKTPDNKTFNALIYSFFATLRAGRGRFDVVHFHAEGPCSMIWIPRMRGIRTVATIHGLDWQRAKWGGFATKFLLLGEKMAVRYADEMVVLSLNVKEYFQNTYGRMTHYIPNGITIPERKAAKLISEKYGLQKKEYILFLARIVPEKGLHYLLEAFRTIHTDKKLVIAGGCSHSNDYMGQIREEAEKDKRVIMTGFIQGQELEELYSNCCLYVLPSDVEGMPISLLEALSYGCSCLVSDIPENREVIGKYGKTFRKGCVSELKEKLEEILNYPQPDEWTDKIREYAERNFCWDSAVQRTLELYRGNSEVKDENINC